MKRYLFLILAGMMAAPVMAESWMPGDSIGTKVVNGKAFVMLRVTKGDNLTAIARQYSATVSYLQEVNNLSTPTINVGQVLLVPSRSNASGLSLGSPSSNAQPEKPASPVVQNPQNPVVKGDPKKHKVEAGESLYAVSRKHGVSVEEIKKWNQLTTDGLKVGQVLIVSNPGAESVAVKTQTTPEKQPDKVNVPVANSPESKSDTPQTQKEKPGVHVVKAGETLYGIARQYGMDARELKVINKIEDTNLKVGQVLRVKTDPPANPNQGTGLIEMIEAGTAKEDTAAVKEAFPDLKVLTAAPGTMIAPAAKVTPYKDKVTGKSYKRVEEEGTVGLIEDYVTDQTKFYAFHRYLPVGSYIRIDFPDKGQSILAEVTSQLPARDPHVVRLSAKCLDYLMIRQPGANVRVRYVIPTGN